MAYRPINTEIWKDDYMLDLSSTEKLLFIYLLTNDFTTQAGIYKLSMNHAAMETGLSQEQMLSCLQKFHADGKIIYNLPTKEIAILNWRKYNENKSFKTMKRVQDELATVKEPVLVLFLYDPRKPLSQFTPKDKDGNEKEEIIILNPFHEFFKDYTDEQIIDTIKDYRNGVSKGYKWGINSPSYITNSLQTQTHYISITNSNSLQTQNINTSDTRGIEEVLPNNQDYHVNDFNYSSILTKAIDEWNKYKWLPKCNRAPHNFPGGKLDDIQKVLKSYDQDQIISAIRNYAEVMDPNNREWKFDTPYKDITGFLVAGVDKFHDEDAASLNFRNPEFSTYASDSDGDGVPF